jgi:hypothetical protein
VVPDPGHVTQLWAGLLPTEELPYKQERHTAGDTFSARLTVHRHWLKVEYPAVNIAPVAKAGELLPPDLRFLAYYDQVDLSRTEVKLLPEGLTTGQKMNRKWPVQVGEVGSRQFLLFARTGREKAELWRALEDGCTYVEDAQVELLRTLIPFMCVGAQGRRETQGERRARYRTYMAHCCAPTTLGVWTTTMCWLNLMIHRVFFKIRGTEFFRAFIRRKIVNRLNKVNFISWFFHNFTVKNIDEGTFPPFITESLEPFHSRLGLFLSFRLQYHGLASARMFLWPQLQVSIRLEVLAVEGVLGINIPQEPTDRIWLGFTEPPRVQLRLYLLLGERQVHDWVVQRILQLILARIQAEIVKSLVLPHMLDVPFCQL